MIATLRRSLASLALNSYRLKALITATEAACLGGAAVLRHHREQGIEATESRSGPVTDADRDSHDAIFDFLRFVTPSYPIRSEEGAIPSPVQFGDSPVWIVDPLDGTREFIQAIPEFSVMVGLVENRASVLGVVYLPDSGRIYLGVSDHAAWRMSDDGQEVRRLDLSSSSQACSRRHGLRMVRSRSHPNERLQLLEKELEPGVILQSGSVGVKCALIAEGEADLYVHPSPHLKEWDTCAPEAVLRGAGGRVTDCDGNRLTYAKPDPRQLGGILAASSADIWQWSVSSIMRLEMGDGMGR